MSSDFGMKSTEQLKPAVKKKYTSSIAKYFKPAPDNLVQLPVKNVDQVQTRTRKWPKATVEPTAADFGVEQPDDDEKEFKQKKHDGPNIKPNFENSNEVKNVRKMQGIKLNLHDSPKLETKFKNENSVRQENNMARLPMQKVFIANLHKTNRWKGALSQFIVAKAKEQDEKFKGRVPIAKESLDRHSRGVGANVADTRTKFHQNKLNKREKAIEKALEQAARTELLLPEDVGFLEAGEGECTRQFTQKQIADSVDITSATKHFELQLTQFGPYRMDYNRSGRYLLLGGRKGHIAAIDWLTKRLYCEMNVMEEIFDVSWLHVETMFAVAQKNWVHIYDNQGIELHCLKQLNSVLRMEFLKYHFLLASSHESGFLSWLDISVGKIVSQFSTRLGRLGVMTQNPANAILHLGHSNGTVTMWSPNVREPVAKMLCHPHAVQAVAIDYKGVYMATASVDRTIKVWDLRKLQGHIQEYRCRAAPSNLAISQRGLMAVGMGNVVEVYKNCLTESAENSYLQYRMAKSVGNFQFCPYEDVLGVAHSGGFTSLIIPGAGEPNFDGLETNPYQTKTQRKEAEVKALLEKIQPEFITMDTTTIAEVDLPTVKEKMEAQLKSLHYRPPKLELEHRVKRGKKGSVQIAKSKKMVREIAIRELARSAARNGAEESAETNVTADLAPANVLDRFRPKKKVKK